VKKNEIANEEENEYDNESANEEGAERALSSKLLLTVMSLFESFEHDGWDYQ
jgi:hypothetical protein